WPRQQVRLLGDNEEVLPGLRVRWMGTHHRSSLAVLIETARGTVGFSDVVFYYDNLERNWPLGINESLEECREAYHFLRQHVDIFVSPYDPTTLTRFPGGRVVVHDQTDTEDTR
ncbi:MAG: hypothetical protein OWQ57_08995, partial [Sulfobacillus sp.]|nr:hypothetical protein [Sulfobacillus sp.]